MKKLAAFIVFSNLFLITPAFADQIDIKKLVKVDNMRFGSTSKNKSVIVICESGFFSNSAKIILENSKGELTLSDSVARFGTVMGASGSMDLSPGYDLSEEAGHEICDNNVDVIKLTKPKNATQLDILKEI